MNGAAYEWQMRVRDFDLASAARQGAPSFRPTYREGAAPSASSGLARRALRAFAASSPAHHPRNPPSRFAVAERSA